jgi:hypothetical protein
MLQRGRTPSPIVSDLERIAFGAHQLGETARSDALADAADHAQCLGT